MLVSMVMSKYVFQMLDSAVKTVAVCNETHLIKTVQGDEIKMVHFVFFNLSPILLLCFGFIEESNVGNDLYIE